MILKSVDGEVHIAITVPSELDSFAHHRQLASQMNATSMYGTYQMVRIVNSQLLYRHTCEKA